MTLRGIRGATCLAANDATEMREAVHELLLAAGPPPELPPRLEEAPPEPTPKVLLVVIPLPTLGRQLPAQFLQDQPVFGLGLRVARPHQLSPVGQRQLHVQHQDVAGRGKLLFVEDQTAVRRSIVRNLKVMDATALALCRDQNMLLKVFSIFVPGALKRVVLGADEGTLVHC